MKLKRIKWLRSFQLVSFFMLIGANLEAQHWNKGDTLKTVATDTARIDALRGNMLDVTGEDLVDTSFPNSIPIFGSNARIGFTGYVKLDYIQDFNGGYDRFQYQIIDVPITGDGRIPQDGYLNMHARESRFGIDIRSITDAGMPVRFYLEWDFYNLDRGPFNQAARLRHVYGVVGRLLFGRTWGTQTDLYGAPNTIDFAAGDALTLTRRAQVRFEDNIAGSFKYAIGLEMLEFPGIDAPDSLGQASQHLPLLAGRITKKTKLGGRLMLGASVFQLRWDRFNSSDNATAIGYGISFSGQEKFGKGHNFRWMTSYGNGWGSQIVSTLGTQASAILTPSGELETMPAWNFGTGLSMRINEKLISNLNFNKYAISPSEFRAINKMKSGESVHLNMIWSPIKSINTGIEFMYLKRINGDGSDGLGRRLQLMIKYLIN